MFYLYINKYVAETAFSRKFFHVNLPMQPISKEKSDYPEFSAYPDPNYSGLSEFCCILFFPDF